MCGTILELFESERYTMKGLHTRRRRRRSTTCFNLIYVPVVLLLVVGVSFTVTISSEVVVWSSSSSSSGLSGSSILSSMSTGHRHRHGDDHSRSRIRRQFGDNSQQSSQPLMESYVNTRQTELYTTYKVDDAVSRVALGNLHKPNFTNCGSYQPQIYEGQPVNTTVIQVEAIDRDPVDSGGNVTYSIVEVSDDFSVEPYTGWVRTKKIFDRDEPSREKEVYVTVRATDNGRPQLDAVCTMKVRILDINDNKPMFDKYAYRGNRRKEYKESIPRDLPVGQVVMRISATDIDDGNNGTVQYRLEKHPSDPSDIEYFNIVAQNGEVTLKKVIQESKRQYFLTAIASDRGDPPLTSMTNLSVFVVEPNKKPPTFIENYPMLIELPERSVDHSRPILTLEARSNTEDNIVFFELVNGQTQPTNKDAVFTLESEGNIAHVKLDRPLDYESVSEYTLTIRASNKYNLATETLITVKVKDENDEKPYFTEVVSGSVLENEIPGTPVMRVRAIDTDGTAPNNEVTYYLKEEDRENFHIDSYSGEITTRKEFDREEQDIYQVTVIARDGAPSALLNNGQPNERPLTLKIEIADKNDNKPVFIKDLYVAEVAEDANLNSKVIEVRAIDNDTASVLTYTITEGDPDNSFTIESTSSSGVVLIKSRLDYERIRTYELTIKASDSSYDAYTKVKIQVTNVNDNPPVFEDMEKNTTIVEESIPSGCIFVLKAFDPDIGDRTQTQNITFFIQKGTEHFSVNDEGCVRVIKPLDRDPPNGYPYPQIIVGAYDEWGLTTTKLSSYIAFTVHLTDINDNAPYLNSTNPVVWDENKPRGVITQLTADDADTPAHGPPFTFSIDPTAEQEIKTLFSVSGSTFSAAHDKFDREARKQYLVPLIITDSGTPQQTGTSILTVIIGDQNDNPMRPGESKILVYKYKENSTFTIGRVYVDDLDDWDLNDKTFYWLHPSSQHNNFNLDPDNGNINMKPSTREDTYRLEFKVKDNARDEEVKAIVNVRVKAITEEAVDSSGSIRFMGITRELFIKPDGVNGKSKLDKLRTEIASVLEIENEDNVDVFTVITSPHSIDQSILDVRYSAHNSPLYQAERLDGMMGQNKERLEKALELNIMMIRIDECLKERVHCESSCTNNLTKSDISYKIFTNMSSFVGVNAIVDPICTCSSTLAPNSCQPNPCLYNGICLSGGQIDGFKCDCAPGYEGPRCESTSISFEGSGWAWYPPLSVCNDSSLNVYFNTPMRNGLLMYNGPIYNSPMNVTDFISLELREGSPVLLMDYGSGVLRLELRTKLNLDDSKNHLISMNWNPSEVSMRVDECTLKDKSCYVFGTPPGSHSFLNVNGPLQLGGLSFNLRSLLPSMKWAQIPTTQKFTGCISNLSLNGQFYNLGDPSYSLGNVSSCDAPRVGVQTATLGVDINFIIILLVCILVLFILVIAIVFYRRRRSYEEVKGDPHDDVRENIINYSDEGGGEGDQTGYDLSVLMKASNGPYIHSPIDKIPMEDLRPEGRVPENSEGPDIQSFLQGNKNKVDNDPDGLPYDDVRNYAYEGDGNSMGSLSSLASGTDDNDLNFDYLPTFGPRFKKLADMYGGQSSDDESYSGPPPEAWC